MTPESQHTEWKKLWKDEYLKWICAFANTNGGTLHIGRDDKGAVVGLEKPQKLLEDLPNKTRDALGILVDVHLRRENSQSFLEIAVEPHPNPISYKGHYYRRSGSTVQEFKGSALDRFLLRRHGRTWDGVPVPGLQFSDLSSRAMQNFRKLAAESGRIDPVDLQGSDENLIAKLKLTDGPYLIRAAALLFHDDPEQYVTGSFVKIGFFRSESDLVYHDTLHGNLFDQVSKAVDLLQTKYLKAAITYQGIQRIERFPIPNDSLREAMLNALVHRDYAIPAPVQIRVYEDRLKIWNPAELPEGWTLQTLLDEHPSVPYNPAIANTFFRSGEIETWGRGIQRIFAACKNAGTPKPKLSYQGNDLWIEFPFAKSYLRIVSPTRKVGDKLDEKLDERLDEKLGENRSKIVSLMRSNPRITVTEIGRKIGISRTAADKNIQILKKDGWVKRVGPAKGGHWEVDLKDEG